MGMKGIKLIFTVATAAMLMIGCASHDQNQGGTSEQGYNNATHGTGSSTATNQSTLDNSSSENMSQ